MACERNGIVMQNTKNLAEITMIMAANKRDEKKTEAVAKIEAALKNIEIEALGDAYNEIQQEQLLDRKTASEKIAKVTEDSKRQLMKKREALITQLFSNIENKLREFIKSEEYKQWFTQKLNKARELVSGEPLEVYVCSADKELVNGDEIKTVSEDFIGGFRAYCPSKHIMIDETISTKIEETREDFHALRL